MVHANSSSSTRAESDFAPTSSTLDCLKGYTDVAAVLILAKGFVSFFEGATRFDLFLEVCCGDR